jgi:hypothetical protein
MKLLELIEKLEEIRDDLAGPGVDLSDVEVLAGIQPTWPITALVLGAVSGEVVADYADGEINDEARKAVWLVTDGVHHSSKIPAYAPKALWDAVR